MHCTVLLHLHVVLRPEFWGECLVQSFRPADLELFFGWTLNESSAMRTAEVDTGMILQVHIEVGLVEGLR